MITLLLLIIQCCQIFSVVKLFVFCAFLRHPSAPIACKFVVIRDPQTSVDIYLQLIYTRCRINFVREQNRAYQTHTKKKFSDPMISMCCFVVFLQRLIKKNYDESFLFYFVSFCLCINT